MAHLEPAADVRLVLSTAPPDQAHDLARRLVEDGVAACVNLVPGLRSVYRWKADVLDQPETLLVLKTAADRVEALAERLVALHPYEVPEILVVAPEAGLKAYLAWVMGSSRSSSVSAVPDPDSGTARPSAGPIDTP